MIVSTLFVLNLKSPGTAGATGAAETVTVTSSLEGPLSIAVTALASPFSEIDAGVSTSGHDRRCFRRP